MIILFSILIAVIVVYAIQVRLYKKHGFEGIDYRVKLSAREVFEGDDIYLYEELTNAGRLPLPYAKVDTGLPDGMRFVLIEWDKKGSSKRRFSKYIRSMFVLKNNQTVRRRWRVNCTKRGVYKLGAVMLIINDIFGFNANSKLFTAVGDNTVVVLPRTMNLEEAFTSSYYRSGEISVLRSLFTDPMMVAGSREYTSYDPMNKIDWKSTAVHNRLMVRVEDHTQSRRFNIVLNMQSRDIEADPTTPSVPETNELCIKVAASLLDMVSAENIAVRVIANAPPKRLGVESVSEDEIGHNILMTRPYSGKYDMIEALRMLAALPMEISLPIEKLLDHMIQNPGFYENGGNIILVSPYISERMINFHSLMKQQGIRVVFYITSTNQNALMIPDDVEVHFRVYA
ncbi:MAG: DUF58 domain-containing protein [Clostridia bacterium]|nr:DUF58 domain-containing protein [Clostridia bacterium]